MAQIDIFNGDADGICALTQLRNAEPVQSTLITGVKRDIALVAKAEVAAGDRITALDLSFDKNRDGVLKALEAGAEVFYVDHHFAGDIPESDKLTTIIDPDPNVCTSLLVNGYLKGRHVEWAVTGAFGDNLKASARTIAGPLDLSQAQLTLLENLGVYMNYNGYGSSVEDLHFAPAELFGLVRPYPTPFEFVEEAPAAFEKLESGYRDDMASAAAVKPTRETEKTAVVILPDEPWARRVSGVYSNEPRERLTCPSSCRAYRTSGPNVSRECSGPARPKAGCRRALPAVPNGRRACCCGWHQRATRRSARRFHGRACRFLRVGIRGSHLRPMPDQMPSCRRSRTPCAQGSVSPSMRRLSIRRKAAPCTADQAMRPASCTLLVSSPSRSQSSRIPRRPAKAASPASQSSGMSRDGIQPNISRKSSGFFDANSK